MAIVFLALDDVLLIHADQIERYGGSTGVRDLRLLESAIAVVQASFAGVPLQQDIYEMAAAYMVHLVKNHPFVDGNKRTGLASALIFLEINGVQVVVDDEALYQLVMDVVANRADKRRASEVLRSSGPDTRA